MYLLIHKNKYKSEYSLKICYLFMEKPLKKYFFKMLKNKNWIVFICSAILPDRASVNTIERQSTFLCFSIFYVCKSSILIALYSLFDFQFILNTSYKVVHFRGSPFCLSLAKVSPLYESKSIKNDAFFPCPCITVSI